jgi:hypothetical protein
MVLVGCLWFYGTRSEDSVPLADGAPSGSATTSSLRTPEPEVEVGKLIENRGNVASGANVSSSDDQIGPFNGLRKAVDGLVNGRIAGASDYDDDVHLIFFSGGSVNRGPFSDSTNELVLDFAPSVDLAELVAYVSSQVRSGVEDSDLIVTAIGFWVDRGDGLELAGTVEPPPIPTMSEVLIESRLSSCCSIWSRNPTRKPPTSWHSDGYRQNVFVPCQAGTLSNRDSRS